MTVLIERATSATADVHVLVEGLDSELSPHYAPEQRHALSLKELFQAHVHFYVAYQDSEPVGCGGVVVFPKFGELKRFYVRPEVRGRGIAKAILSQIRIVAIHSGVTVLRLETGDKQHAALGFYNRCGFRACGPFEPYKSMPTEYISNSIFMEVQL